MKVLKVLKCWREKEIVDDKPTRNTVVENVFSGFHHCGFLGVYRIPYYTHLMNL